MSASKSESYEGKTMSVMVLRSKSLKRVIYLECGKDFADILLSLLIMPIGAILKTLDDGGLGVQIKRGLFNLYERLGSLEDSTLEVEKTTLIDPAPSCSSALLRISASPSKSCLNVNCGSSTLYDNQVCDSCEAVSHYKCKHCSRLYEQRHERCCNSPLESAVCLRRKTTDTSGGSTTKPTSAQGGEYKGIVKDNITFMIKEDLSIIKSSTIRSMSLLQSMKATNFLDLDTKEIFVGRNEGLLLVKAALVSDRPLTDVFEPFFSCN